MLDQLSLETIEAIFDALPVEVSFVDANDTVRYYSKGGRRIFKRTPAVIGRKVQNCHPKKSVDVVQRVMDDLRAGRREEAAFWIDLNGRKMYIRYFPVRDKNGDYIGTLEVTQDITEIKTIEGQRRLLD